MPEFADLLLAALRKSPPKRLNDLGAFFDRSRARLEISLDKGGVYGSDREAYLTDFEVGVEEAQRTYFDDLLLAQSAEAEREQKQAWYRQPIPLMVGTGVFLIGVIIGIILGR